MTNYFPLVSSIIAGIFAMLLAVQYIKRRKNHQLIWTVALIMWFLTTLFEFLAEPEVFGSTVEMYKVFYILTAPMVALLGVGTLYLLTHKSWGKYFLIYTVILSIPFFALGLTASVDPQDLTEGFQIAGQAMPQQVRIFSPLFTVPGGILLIGGALYSHWLDRTRKYNLLIALGGIFPFLGGSASRFGGETFFYAFETIGAILLFLGFLLSREYIRKRAELRKQRERNEDEN